MKKSIFLFLVIASIIGINTTQTKKENSSNISDLVLENVNALAQGEVIIPGVCIAISSSICILYDDGYFLTGERYV